MNWVVIENESQLLQAVKESDTNPAVFFKHSNRCSISATAKDRFERNYAKHSPNNVLFFYIDVVANRPVSLKLAEITGITHESPQTIVFYKGNVLYHESHMGIQFADVLDAISAEAQ